MIVIWIKTFTQDYLDADQCTMGLVITVHWIGVHYQNVRDCRWQYRDYKQSQIPLAAHAKSARYVEETLFTIVPEVFGDDVAEHIYAFLGPLDLPIELISEDVQKINQSWSMFFKYFCCCASTSLQKLKIGFKEKIRSSDSEEENDNWEDTDNWEDAHSVGSAFSYTAPAVKNYACTWEYLSTQEIIDQYRDGQENDVAAFLKKNELTHG